MLHLLVYDDKILEVQRERLCAKIESIGTPNFCLNGFVLIHTSMLAWQVDGAIRAVLRDDEFAVFDITGMDEDKYFGRLRNKVNGRCVWDWIAANNF